MASFTGIPSEVWSILTSLEKQSNPPSWTLQKTASHVVLSVKWTLNHGHGKSDLENSNRPPCLSTKGSVTHMSSAVKPPSGDDVNTMRTKRKSPSRKRRDKQRLQAWKLKKRSGNQVNDRAKPCPAAVKSPPTQRVPDSVVASAEVCSTPQLPPTGSLDTAHVSPRTTDLDATKVVSGSSQDISSMPTSLSSHVPDVTRSCSYCSAPESDTVKVRFCTQCMIVAYCSKQCQSSHWKSGHKDWCAKAARAANSLCSTDDESLNELD